MAGDATLRYGFRPAPPGGLALVQDFLNTRPHARKGPDLLGSGEDARAWAATAMGNWSVLRGMQIPALTLTDDDAARLNSAKPPRHVLEAADLTLGAGEMSWMRSGYGWRWLGSAIVGEVVMSQETGTWRRMKQCRNPHCRATFYDSSWNNRGVCRHPSATSAC
jgi:hypothetical protein